METAPLYFVLYARAEYDSDTAGDTGRPPCMGFDFRAIRYLLRLNLDIKKHDLEKSRVFMLVFCIKWPMSFPECNICGFRFGFYEN